MQARTLYLQQPTSLMVSSLLHPNHFEMVDALVAMDAYDLTSFLMHLIKNFSNS